MVPRKRRIAEEEEKEKPKFELAVWVTRSAAQRGARINSDNSVAELQKTELLKVKKAEKDVELKVVEEEVEDRTKIIVIEFFFRFFLFFLFFFFRYFVSVWLQRKVKQKIMS